MRIKAALDCPYKLQMGIDKRPVSDPGTNYHLELGKLVQKVWELYFNQGLNKIPKMRSEKAIEAVIRRIKGSKMYRDIEVTQPFGVDRDFEKEFEEVTLQSLLSLNEAGLMDKKVLSEQKWISRFRDWGS